VVEQDARQNHKVYPQVISAAENRLTDLVIGQSPAIRYVLDMVRQVAHYPTTTVLLQGESGTGKEVIAQAIHMLSILSSGQFVPINCAAIPEMLLETELFGVEAGAYTDAKVSRDGYVIRAHNGTLFLDEIGSMPLSLQAKLLRFLEARSFRRVGSTRELRVHLRVISATNVDLQMAVAQKKFRDDLFYRLKVFSIFIPPLRERKEDIPLLVDQFLRLERAKTEGCRQCPLQMSDDAMKLLMRYSWPGNIRELRSLIEHCCVLCDGPIIQVQHLPVAVQNGEKRREPGLYEAQQQLHLPEDGVDLPAFLSSIEYSFIQEALERCQGNQVRAAALLGISRDQLRYRLYDKGKR